MALVNGGFMHYNDMKKFLKNLLLSEEKMRAEFKEREWKKQALETF